MKGSWFFPAHRVLKLNFGNLLEVNVGAGQFGFGHFVHRPCLLATVAIRAVGTVSAFLFIFGEREMAVVADFVDEAGQGVPIAFVLGGIVGEVRRFGREIGVPVNHLDLFRLEGIATVQDTRQPGRAAPGRRASASGQPSIHLAGAYGRFSSRR